MPPDAAWPAVNDPAQSSSTMTLQNTVNFTGESNKGVQVGVNTGTIGDIIFNERKANDKCLNDLRLTNPRDDKERIRDTKGGLLEGSYKWILDHSDFQRWRNDSQMRLLWVKGDPGKGKTMLLIGIVDELERHLAQLKQAEQLSCPTAISYFFCQGTDSNLNNVTAVLRGLIYLLAVQQPSLASNLRKEYECSGSKLFEDGNAFFALSTILSSMLQDPSLARTYIVIDALDECETGLPQLLKLVVGNMSASRVKWLVSSRNRHDIELLLKLDDSQTKLSPELKTNAEYVSHAVGVYIDDRVSQLKSLQGDGVPRDQVRHVLRQKAADTLLWVALVIQELETVASWDVLAVLEEMPTSLEELYARMLKQIQQLKRGNSEFCRLMLSAATLAYRPLHVLELGVLSGLPELISKNNQRVRDLVSMCGSFLTVRDDRVYIIHQSAKDYLSAKAASTIFLSGTAEAHRDISLRSLQAMSNTLRRDVYSLQNPGFSIDNLRTPVLDPLASVRYSCVHWVDHLCEAPQQKNDLVDGGLVDKFLEGYLLYWAEASSLLGALSDAVLAVGKLERHLKTISSESSLLALTQDAYRFLLHSGLVIKNTPLQIYVSALLFSPTRSITRDLFRIEEPRWVLIRPTLNVFWGPLVRTLEGHGDWVLSVEFSPDGKLIASGSDDKTIKVWDAATGELKHTLNGHGDWVLSVVFSPNGKLIASGSSDKTIRIWDAATGEVKYTLNAHGDWVLSVVFSPNGKLIASGSSDKTIKVWDAATGEVKQTLESHRGAIGSVIFSPDGKLIASGSDDKTIKVWDAATGELKHTLNGHGDWVLSVVFSPNGKLIASGSSDKTIKVWDAATGKVKFEDHGDCVLSVVFSPNGKLIASGSSDRTIKVWDVATGEVKHALRGHSSGVKSVVFSPDGKHIASGSDDKTIKVWDLATDEVEQFLESSPVAVEFVVFSPDGKLIASGSSDKTIKVWDAATGKVKFEDHGDCVLSVAFSPDEKLIALGSSKSLEVRDAATGEIKHRFRAAHNNWVRSVAFSLDGSLMASGSDDKTIKIWDGATGRVKHTLQGHGNWVRSVAFSPDGKLIASGSSDRTIKVWDVATGEVKHTLESHRSVNSISFDTTGLYLFINIGFAEVYALTDIEANGPIQPQPQARRCEYSLTPDKSWITWNEHKVLLLPSEYRPSNPQSSAIWHSVSTSLVARVAIGCDSGRVIVISFLNSPAGLPSI